MTDLTSTQSRQLASALEVAGRDSTDENTALNAVRQVQRLLSSVGKTFTDLTLAGAAPAVSAPKPKMTYAQKKASLEALESENARLSRELDKALKELATFKSTAVKVAAVRDDGTIAWPKFEMQAVSKNGGKMSGWRAAFARHAQIHPTVVDQWRSQGFAPAEGVEALKTFKAEGKSDLDWTFARDDEVAALVAEGKSDRQMEAILTKRWGTPVFFGSVKKSRQRLHARAYTLSLYDSGVTDQDEILTALIDRFKKGYGGVSKQKVKEVLAHFRPED